MTSIKRVVEYLRKSTDEEDRQIQSLANQTEENQKLAEDYQIIKSFSESISAKTPHKRAEFDKMVKTIKDGGIDGIIAWDAKRLSRNPTESGLLQQMLVDGGVFIKTHFNYYDRSNWFMFLIDSGVATQDIINLSENVKRGLDSKVRLGHRPGKAPLGYVNRKRLDKGKKDIVADKERFRLMKKWFEIILSGDTVEHSLQVITDMGLDEPRTSQRPRRTVSRTLAYKIFRNSFYAGKFWWKGELITGAHKPLISWNEYETIQSILGRGARKHIGDDPRNEMGALVSLIKCKECGSTLVFDCKNKIYKNGTSQKFTYYRCPHRNGSCTTTPIKAVDLYDQALSYLDQLSLHPEFTDWCRKVLKRRNQNTFDLRCKQIEIQTKRLKEIDQKVEILITKKIDQWISEKEYQGQKAKLRLEKEKVLDMANNTEVDKWEKVVDKTLDFAESMKTIFNEGNPDTKRQALKILGSDLTFDKGKLLIDPKYCFIFLRETQDKLLYPGVGLNKNKKGLMNSNQIKSRLLEVPSGAGEGSRTPFISLES